MKRRAEVFLYDHPRIAELVSGARIRALYDWLRDHTRPFRVVLKKRLHINLTDAA